MAAQVCKCSHERRDHRVVSAAGRGPCNQCLCDAFVSVAPPRVKPKVVMEEEQAVRVQRDWMLR
jgi:hypothetical protein